jgi:hypothetical protein
VCCTAFCRFFGIGSTLLASLRRQAADGVVRVSANLPSAANTFAASLRDRRNEAHALVLREILPLVAEELPTNDTDSACNKYLCIWHPTTRASLRDLVAAELERLRIARKSQLSPEEYLRHDEDIVMSVWSPGTFNRLLRHLYPHLSFRRRNTDLAECDDCTKIRSSLARAGGDEDTKQALRRVRDVHVTSLRRNRQLFTLLRQISLSRPRLLVFATADQAFPGYLPHASPLPKSWERFRRLSCELIGVSVALEPVGHPYYDAAEMRSSTVFVYPPESAANWSTGAPSIVPSVSIVSE